MARTVCLWCPDWPVVALIRTGGAPSDAPVVVLEDGRVRAASAEARAVGIRRGQRLRDAEACCPAVRTFEADLGVEAREFEAVARSIDAVTPRVAIERPGLLSFPARGPARYFGDDEAVVEQVRAAVEGAGGVAVESRVGIAGTHFAAHLAARQGCPASVVSDDDTIEFLARHPVSVLGARGGDGLPGLLVRLGIRFLGDLAALSESTVATRFGPEGVFVHRLARGLEPSSVPLGDPPPDLAELLELDPPAQRIDAVAFAAKGLADRLLEHLARRGLACTRVVVEAETEHGERLARTWRHHGMFTAAELAQRVRWQLDAWLTGRSPGVPDGPFGVEDGGIGTTGGLTLLRLVPEDAVEARGRQLGFWGGDQEAAERMARVLARLQGMLGHRSVVTPAVQGGRIPTEQATWIPWGDPRPPSPPERTGRRAGEPEPWPGAVPPPAPTRVYEPPLPAELVDARRNPVRISGRGEVSADPSRLTCEALGVRDGSVDAWAGPWVHDVRWWVDGERRRRALFQVVVGGVAILVTIEGGRAGVAAVYD